MSWLECAVWSVNEKVFSPRSGSWSSHPSRDSFISTRHGWSKKVGISDVFFDQSRFYLLIRRNPLVEKSVCSVEKHHCLWCCHGMSCVLLWTFGSLYVYVVAKSCLPPERSGQWVTKVDRCDQFSASSSHLDRLYLSGRIWSGQTTT